MLRRIFTGLLVDDQMSPDMDEDVEKQLQALEHSGIILMDWAIADWNDSDPWTRYIGYLMSWAITHAGGAYKGMTPASFDEWSGCEDSESDEIVMQLIKSGVRAEWLNIGEGLTGDYNPEDQDDIQLLRFDISVRNHGKWAEVEDASYCTQMPADTLAPVLEPGLRYILDEYVQTLRAHPFSSVKKLGERLSWLSPEDFEEAVK